MTRQHTADSALGRATFEPMGDMALDPTSPTLLVTSGKQLLAFDVSDPRTLAPRVVFESDRPLEKLAVSPDGQRIAVSTYFDVSLLDATGARVGTLALAQTAQMVFVADGTLMAERRNGDVNVASPDGTIRQLERKPGTIEGFALSVTPDGTWAASSTDSHVRLYEVAKGTQFKRLVTTRACRHAFSPDGLTLVHAAKDHSGLVVLGVGKKWPTLDTVALPPWPGMTSRVTVHEIGFSPDGSRLWCTQHDVGYTARVSVWDWPARTMLHAIDLPATGDKRPWPRFTVSDGRHAFVAMHRHNGGAGDHELLSFDVS